MSDTQRCGNCRFYGGAPIRIPEANGSCFRNPPMVIPLQDGTYDIGWPPVMKNAWCGEYQLHRPSTTVVSQAEELS